MLCSGRLDTAIKNTVASSSSINSIIIISSSSSNSSRSTVVGAAENPLWHSDHRIFSAITNSSFIFFTFKWNGSSVQIVRRNTHYSNAWENWQVRRYAWFDELSDVCVSSFLVLFSTHRHRHTYIHVRAHRHRDTYKYQVFGQVLSLWPGVSKMHVACSAICISYVIYGGVGIILCER